MSIEFKDIDPNVPSAGEALLTLRCAFSDLHRESLAADRELAEEMRHGAIERVRRSLAALASHHHEELGGAVDRFVEHFGERGPSAISKHDFGRIAVDLINAGAPIKGRNDFFSLNPCRDHPTEGMHMLDYVAFASCDQTGRPSNRDVVAATRRLVEEGELHPDSVTNDGRTPLAMTSRNQNLAMLEYLLEAGANPNPLDPRTKESFISTLERMGLHQMHAMVKAVQARAAVDAVVAQARNRKSGNQDSQP